MCRCPFETVSRHLVPIMTTHFHSLMVGIRGGFAMCVRRTQSDGDKVLLQAFVDQFVVIFRRGQVASSSKVGDQFTSNPFVSATVWEILSLCDPL